MQELIEENHNAFAVNDLELGRTETVEMNIDTGNQPPVYTKPCLISLMYRKVITKAIGDMLEARVTERAPFSPWNSPIVMITKKDDSHRFCCVFR